MNDMTITEFCDSHRACKRGRDWALENCADMHEAWATAKQDWLLWIATCPGVLTDRELQLFSVWCARIVAELDVAARAAAKWLRGNCTPNFARTAK